MNISIQRLLILALLCFNLSVHALPEDEQYYVIETNDFHYIFSEHELPYMSQLIHYSDKLHELYKKEFDWELDERGSLVLTSQRQQLANGFATFLPNIETTFFNGGPQLGDSFASTSWLYTLLTHELTHLYQLNAKSKVGAFYKKIFGNTTFSVLATASPIPFVIPFFPSPNFLMPTYMLEGNATYNEARFGLGGRLYSGHNRALVYSLLNEDKVTPKNSINSHLNFPFGRGKYIVGSYLFNDLQENIKPDNKSVNIAFKNNSSQIIIPLMLNSTYGKSFGEGYVSHFNDFNRRLKEKAQNLRKPKKTALYKSLSQTPLNSDDKEIFFLSNESLNTYPRIHRLNKESTIVESDKIDIKSGKLFKKGHRILSRGTGLITPVEQKYSLWGESDKQYPNYIDKYVYDIKAGHTAYAKVSDSYDQTQLYVDDKFISSTQSSALLDDDGHVYYFKQDGEKRSLYKNNTELLSFNSHYSYPVDINSKGEIYFISTTENGSGLFVAKNTDGKYTTSEALPYDTIVDARLINDKAVFVTEITAHGYEYKALVLPGSKPEIPATYNYKMKQKPENDFFKDKAPTVSYKKREYNSLLDMRYSGLEIPFLQYSPAYGVSFASRLLFQDPLAFSTAVLGFNLINYDEDLYFNYSYTKRRLAWYIGGSFERDATVKLTKDEDDIVTDAEVIARFEEQFIYTGVYYPLFQYYDWKATLGLELNFEKKLHLASELSEQGGAYTDLRFSKTKFYGLSYLPHRAYALTFSHWATTGRASNWEDINSSVSAELDITFNLGLENYIQASFFAGFAPEDNLEIENSFTSQKYRHTRPFRISALTPGLSRDVEEAESVLLKYTRPFHTGWYFTKIPLGLRRIAPFIVGQHFRTKTTTAGKTTKEFNEWGVGATFEWLLFHKLPIRVNFAHYDNDLPLVPSSWQFQLSKEIKF